MNDVITNPRAEAMDRGSVSHDSPADEGATYDTSEFGAHHGVPHRGASAPAAPRRKPQLALALTWWTACTLWAYFVFGELVVAAGYPEALAALGVVAGFSAAGRRVHALFDGSRAVAIAAISAALLTTASVIVVPVLLVTFLHRSHVALAGLLCAPTIALVTLWRLRRREHTEDQGEPTKLALAKVLAWLLALVFTGVALALAA